MITADSSVWVQHFRGQVTPAVSQLRALLQDGVDDIVLLDLVLMKVLRGFVHDRDWQLARTALAALPLATAGGEAVALRAAGLHRQQRRRGITIRSSIDLLVAAWCLEHGCALLHADRDFDGIEGLAGAL